jgi:lipase
VTIGRGPPALLIHCSLGRHEMLLPLAGMLACHAKLFDLPGHGRSPDWDGVTDYHALTTGIAAGLAAPGSHLIGHSFGATVALRLAVERPDLVARLTLIEPVFFAAARNEPEFPAHINSFAPFAAAIAAGDLARAAQVFTDDWGAAAWDSLPPKAQATVVRRIHLIPAAEPAISQDNARLLAPGRLAGVTCPVTLIRGDASPAIIGAVHRALARLMPQSRLIVIPGAGHMVAVTHAEEVAKAMA